jgi:acetylornithine/N-succinyldiaminopimelate aminotransferase
MQLDPSDGEGRKTIASTPGARDLLALADKRLLGNYRPARVVMARGQGTELFDVEGRRYLDFCAGVAVCSLGHAHPELVRVVSTQVARLVQVSNYVFNEENVLLAEELCAATGYDRVFFCNSGTEAIEALIKLVRRYFHDRAEPERIRLIAFERSFHGRTLGALALTGNAKYHLGFGPPLSGVTHVPYGDLAQVQAVMGPDVAAVVVEPVQGEGGVLPAPEGFLQGLRQLCDAHGALLACDEVQVGVGRTGRWLGADHFGVRADAITLAKGLGGGVPIGALLLREKLAQGLPAGSHGSTFGGNALSSAAARTVLRLLRDEGLVEHAARMGEHLGHGLRSLAARHPRHVVGERGLGLLRALVLRDDALTARELLEPARERGLLLTAAGDRALRFTPPLTVSAAEIDEALAITDATFAAL